MKIAETIESSIAELVAKLPHADTKEAARIHARIDELEKLQEEYRTT